MASNPKPYAYQTMEEHPHALDRLDIQFRWGGYGIRMLRFHLAMFPPGHTIQAHKHSEFEFHFIPRGKGKVMFGSVEHALKEGLFYLTGPGVVHAQETDASDPMHELCLHIDIVQLDEEESAAEGSVWGAVWEAKEAEECIRRIQGLPLVPVLDQYNAMQYFLTAYRAWHENQPGLFTTIKHSIIQILLRAARAYAPEHGKADVPSRDMNAYRYKLATQFIQDNYSSQLTLESVAEKLQLSGRQLQRIFAEQGNETFSEYLENVRLSRICAHLLGSDDTIERIALAHGFSTSNYFHHVFKKRFGLTAKQYRERQKRGGV
jgi:AraC-like DNA-binding protein/mannose-6-phosphate isomerase-like protein (cupin superfamily)